MVIEEGYIPDFSSTRLDEIAPITEFVSKKMVALRNTLVTSTEVDEQIDTLSKLMLCQSSISLLSLVFLSDDFTYIERAKHLYRGIN